MTEATPEIRTACWALHAHGRSFYVVTESALECGCVVRSGWITRTAEQGVALTACSTEHELEMVKIQQSLDDPGAVTEFWDVEASLAVATRLSRALGVAIRDGQGPGESVQSRDPDQEDQRG